MKNKLPLLAIALTLVLSGCTTMHFDNGNMAKSGATQKWHHNFAFALYEASAPVALDNECSNKNWASVKTELTFINGLASGAVNVLGPIWYPKTVDVSCEAK